MNNNNDNNQNNIVREMRNAAEIFSNYISYYSHNADDSGANFLVVDLVKTNQWMKIMLNPDYTWGSYIIMDGKFSMIALSNKEPSSIHFRKPHLFGIEAYLILPKLIDVLIAVGDIVNDDGIKLPREAKAISAFNDQFHTFLEKGEK